MAEQDYARLGCAGCGAPVLPTLNKDGSARKSQGLTCSPRCANRKHRGQTVEGKTCLNCSTPMQASRKHCSAGCRKEFAQKRKDGRKPTPFTQMQRACQHCGAIYSGKQKTAKFCSRACNMAAFKARHDPQRDERARQRQADKVDREALMRSRLALRQQEKCAQQMAKLAAQNRARERACRCCGVPYSMLNRIAAHFCSDDCASRQAKAQKAAARIARKALQRARRVEPVNPLRVFRRDGWRCYLCGCVTPEALRGTFEPNSPEIEHVIPLARGGEHSYMNVRCACRACNAIKGDRSLDEIGGPWAPGGGIELQAEGRS